MKYIYILIFTLLSFSCSNDDATQENSPLGDFTIMTENITSTSVEINWTTPENSDNTNVVYSIYLDDTLQQENITGNEFLLEELIPVTDYIVKVEASNEFSSKTSTLNFSTPEIPILYTTKISLIDPCGFFDISYGVDAQVEKIFWNPDCGTPSAFEQRIAFEYNAQGKLISHQESGSDFEYTIASFTYLGDHFDEIYVNRFLSDGTILEEYDYSEDFVSYNYKRTVNFNGNSELVENSENNLLKDGQNRVTQHYKTDAIENFEKTYEFEYQNENLTKISDSEGNVWQIAYDTHSNFLTFYSGHLGGDPKPRGFFAGFHFLSDDDLKDDLARIPDFINYRNKNNPIEYRKNGIVFRTIDYEYNESNYPNKILLENGSEFVIEYTEL